MERRNASIATVICHYNPTRHPYLQHMVCLCVRAQQKLGDDGLEIFLCDGSPEPDPFLQDAFAAEERVHYLHGGRQLSFGETYNLGVHSAETDYVVLIANDVFISSKQIRRLVRELRDGVGCAIPYLTRADYLTQVHHRGPVPRRCYPASMTINVNAFRRDELLELGGVPEALSGCFNDAVIHQTLRERGRKTVLVDVGEIDHLRAITRRTASNVAYERDLALAPSLCPSLFVNAGPTQRNFWARVYANSAQTRGSRWLWRLISLVPWRVDQGKGVGYAAARIEPFVATDMGQYIRFVKRKTVGRG